MFSQVVLKTCWWPAGCLISFLNSAWRTSCGVRLRRGRRAELKRRS